MKHLKQTPIQGGSYRFLSPKKRSYNVWRPLRLGKLSQCDHILHELIFILTCKYQVKQGGNVTHRS